MYRVGCSDGARRGAACDRARGGLWWDELRTLIDSVRAPVAQIVTTFPSNNQHTLYWVLAHASIALFADEAWSLRLPAALFGVAAPAGQ